MASATAPDASITSVTALCRPKRSASSLPRMLDGMATMLTRKLTITGSSGVAAPLRATTKAQNATIQVRMP